MRTRESARAAIVGVLVAFSGTQACTSVSPPQLRLQGEGGEVADGAGPPPSSGSASSSGGATNGSSSTGSSGATGSSSGGSSSGASGSSGSTSGGSSSGGSGAGGSSSGVAGPDGAAGGALGDGGTAVDKAVAQVLDGYALLKPCQLPFKTTPNPVGNCCCTEVAANENQHITRQFGGDSTVTYNVTVRVAGVAERYWYTGGTQDPVSKLFYVGGLPTIHSAVAPNTNLAPGKGACKIHPPQTDNLYALPFTVPVEINPSDGCFNGFNVFAMVVSAPKQSYYLNYTTDFDHVDRQPHQVYPTDYTVTFPVKGQAQIDFYLIDGDHHEVANDGTMVVPNLKTAQPYIGDFLEFTVLGVTRAN
jgi:hypothetical protein